MGSLTSARPLAGPSAIDSTPSRAAANGTEAALPPVSSAPDARFGGVWLSDAQITVYLYAVRHGRIEPGSAIPESGVDAADVARLCEELQRLKLLARDPACRALTPVHPETARRLLNEPLDSEIRSRQRTIDGNNRLLKQVADVLGRPEAYGGGVEGVHVVTDPEQVRRQMATAAFRCEKEVVTTHVGAQTDAGRLGRSVEAEVAMLRRGVARRLLCQHICRTSLGMQNLVRKLTEHDAEVRTTSEGFEAISIIDRKTAFVPYEPLDGGTPGVVVITHHAVVQFLYRGFERLWSSAMPFEGEDAAHDKASSDNRLLLLRLMVSGLKDEAIAHRLGVATRTCRRHMSALMEELGATSRLQAGLKIAQLGILPPERTAPPHQYQWADVHPLS